MTETDGFVEGVRISTTKIKIKHLIGRTIFILLALQGLRGLFTTVRDIFVVYPKIELYYQQLNFDQSAYNQVLQKAVIVSVTSFIEMATGLALMVKKSSTVKTLHTLIALAILLASLYLKREGALPDFESIEKLALVINSL